MMYQIIYNGQEKIWADYQIKIYKKMQIKTLITNLKTKREILNQIQNNIKQNLTEIKNIYGGTAQRTPPPPLVWSGEKGGKKEPPPTRRGLDRLSRWAW